MTLWNVELASFPTGNYGWGYVKLEPLFSPAEHRFLVVDSDTIFLGPVLDAFRDSCESFIVDDERLEENEVKRLYYDWKNLRAIDAQVQPPRFVFNSGQWFGTSGLISRADFSPWIMWQMPRVLRHPQYFKQGEQGILNYVLNQRSQDGSIVVKRQKLMRWAGHDLSFIRLDEVTNRNSPRREILHWAGYKSPRLRLLPRADLLMFFEKQYYSRHPRGESARAFHALYHATEYKCRLMWTKVQQKMNRHKLS